MSAARNVGEFVVEVGCDRLDFTRVHKWLSQDAYWSKGIERERVEKAFMNSLSFGVFHQDDALVGVARLVTDKATFSYLADVFIDPEFRGQGLGKLLMETIATHPDMQGLRRQMLATHDAHKLYEAFGYSSLGSPEILMEKLPE